ncbi:MAG: ATP-binding protein [Bacteroidota bacterium]|nr:ATP-binding protein [Bacteroidota bacterium]MDP4195263.1 ATP-binding protein [Bacteroidota bacterium]
MTNFLKNLDNLRPNIFFSYLAIALIFILDLNTHLGYAIEILYLIPLLTIPYKIMGKLKISAFAAIISCLIWINYYNADPENLTSKTIFMNKLIVTLILWVITYVQVQRSFGYKRLLKSEEEYRLLSEELKRSQLMFERAENLAHVGSWVMDVSVGEIELSDELVKILGLESGKRQININEYLSMVHPDDKEMITGVAAKHHKEGSAVDVEYRIVRPDGELRYIHGISSSEQYKAGKGTIIRYGAAKDITAHKVIEMVLERERELFEGIFSSIPVMITIYDPNLKHFRFNEALHKVLGWTMDDASEGNFIEKVYPDPLVREAAISFMQSLEPEWREFPLTAKDGSLAESSWSNIRLNNGIQIGIGIDLRQIKQTEKKMKDALQKLERSNKELEQFAYIASHDLQEPLRMVANYMKLLDQKYKDQLDDKAKQYIYYAVDGSIRMGNLIKDLLKYSKVTSQAKKFERVDLNNIYNEVLNDIQILVDEKKAKITAAKLPCVYADPTQMHQLLQNLVVNAIKFHSDKSPEVDICAEKNNKKWIISIKDNGIGIDTNSYERIFHIFQRLHEKEKYPGTGIGLAICKKIVEHHGGKIWLESELGKGTTFYFSLPEHNSLIN